MATNAGLADSHSSNARRFTEAEIIHLQEAADILRIPLRQLLHTRSAQDSPTPTVSDNAYPSEQPYALQDAAHGLEVDHTNYLDHCATPSKPVQQSIVSALPNGASHRMSRPRYPDNGALPLQVAVAQSPLDRTQLTQSRTFAETNPAATYASLDFNPAWSWGDHNSSQHDQSFDAASSTLAPSSWSSLSPPLDQYAQISNVSNGFLMPQQALGNGANRSDLFYDPPVISNDFHHPLSRMTALAELDSFASGHYNPNSNDSKAVDVPGSQNDLASIIRDTSNGWNGMSAEVSDALMAPSSDANQHVANTSARRVPSVGPAAEPLAPTQALQRHSGRDSLKRPRQHRNYPTTPYQPQCFVSSRGTEKKCMQCRLEHKKCERRPGQTTGDCLRCEGLRSTGRITSMAGLPCVYYQIVDATLFRTNVDPIARRMINYNDPPRLMAESILKPISSLAWQPVTKQIYINQGIGRPLCLDVRPFDQRSLVFTDEDRWRQALFRHNYGLADLDETQRRLEDFIRGNVDQYVSRRLKKTDLLTLGVFHMALRMRNAKKDPILGEVLQLWTAARFVESGWRYTNSETLGLQPDPESGIVELPESEIIDYQFTTIIIHNVLLPLRQRVTKRLQALIHSKKPQWWLTIFLTSFILLHSFTLLMRQQEDFSSEFPVQVKYTNMRLIRNILMDAKAILFHFHYINKGVGPFLLDWSGTKPPRTAKSIFLLNEEESMFVRRIAMMAKEKREVFRALAETQNYEDEHWFTGQLFIDRWLPTEAIKIEESPPRRTSMVYQPVPASYG